MTEKRDISEENDLVSMTECTGAAPRAMDEEAAETLADLTSMRCSPSFSAADPSRPPQPDGNVRPSDTHSSQRNTPACRPAKKEHRCHRGSARNP